MSLLHSISTTILEHPRVYLTWQAPFVKQKLAPVLAALEVRPARRVLDVGCGPGTNASAFRGSDYVGVDLNERYVRYAQRRGAGRFLCADAVDAAALAGGQPFDLVLCNSLFHHLDDEAVDRTLAGLAGVLAPGGRLHIVDLLLPPSGLARRLALADRGRYARTLEAWTQLFGRRFVPLTMEPFDVGAGSLALWKLVHFVGEPRT